MKQKSLRDAVPPNNTMCRRILSYFQVSVQCLFQPSEVMVDTAVSSSVSEKALLRNVSLQFSVKTVSKAIRVFPILVLKLGEFI